jgi:hypothetical protein
VTKREVTGDAARSKYRAAKKVADELGLTDEVLATLAEGVREFDAEQSAEARRTRALERIASSIEPSKSSGDAWRYEEQRLRRREVYAQELTAISMLADQASIDKIVSTSRFRALLDRLGSDVAPS